jgi:hypothetical protein
MLPRLSILAHALLPLALVGGAAVALPAAARAQSIAPERALLNRVVAVQSVAAPATAIPVPTETPIDGERALLSHSQAAALARSNEPVTIADASRVDGVRALLNRASS